MWVPRGVLVSCTWLFFACATEPREARVVLELPVAIGCRPTHVENVRVTALGDFPASSENVLVVDPGTSIDRIERFPDDTRLLAIEATGTIGSERWVAGGVAPIDEGEVRVPLLRYDRGCPLADVRARVPEGAAVVALPDGRLWIAGGHEGDSVLASIVTVRSSDTLATPSAVRLFVERTGATASLVGGDRIVLAGGSGVVGGEGEDTFEIVQVSSDERVGDGFLVEPRREHAAIALGERVLLSGGRAMAGHAPLGSVEALTIDEDAGGSVIVGELSVPRAGHVMLGLDDGSVAIAGGVDERGAPIAVVERFDPGADALDVLGTFETAREDAAYLALPGARVAQIGGREGDEWTGHVELVLETGDALHLDGVLPALERPVAAAVGGKVLVIGRDPATGRARGVVLDPDAVGFAPRELEPSRAARRLVPLADGSFAEGDELGLSMLRVDLATPLDPPPASIAPAFMEDRERLALDAPSRWRAREGVLEAAAVGARFDVPMLRFAELALTLDARGAMDVLLVRDDGPPVVIELAQDGAALGTCRAPRGDGLLRLVRTGDRLVLDGGSGAVECSAELPERIGVAVRAREIGAGVRRIQLERR